MAGAKDIVFSMIRAKGTDLQKSSAVDQVMYRTVAEELLKHADSGTYPLSFPPVRSTEPGTPGIGNPAVPDKPQIPSEYSKQYCSDKLTAGGITDQGLIDEICNSWTGAVPPEAGQNKSASVVNPNSNAKPTWMIARENMFIDGSSYPKQRFESPVSDTKQSKSAAIANQPNVPDWIQTTFQFRANNPDIGYENLAKQTQLKHASMKSNAKKPDWLVARNAFLTRS